MGSRGAWWLALALAGCSGPTTAIDLDVSLGSGEPAPQTLTVSLFDEHRVRLSGVPTKNASLPRQLHIEAGALEDGPHELRVLVRGGPTPVMDSARLLLEPG